MEKNAAFAGFPAGNNNPYVPLPEVFFTHLLPQIEDPVELKVTLHLFYLLARKRGQLRGISDRELYRDRTMLHSIRRPGDPRTAEDHLRQGLELCVTRGTLLRVSIYMVSEDGNDGEPVAWYFFNTARNKKIVADLEGGSMIPARLLLANQPAPQHTKEDQEQEDKTPVAEGVYARPVGHEKIRTLYTEVERPNIFVLYEQNIGLLTPLIAEELKDAARQYPMEWVEAAFREAVHHNKRKWSYIRAILRRWETEGRQQWNA